MLGTKVFNFFFLHHMADKYRECIPAPVVKGLSRRDRLDTNSVCCIRFFTYILKF